MPANSSLLRRRMAPSWGHALGESLALAVATLARLPGLRDPKVSAVFHRQVLRLGVAPSRSILMRGAILGTLLIAFVIKVLASNSGLAVDLLIYAVVREAGPLFVAVLLTLHSGTLIAHDVQVMIQQDQAAQMRALGRDPLTQLLLPRVAALMLACPVLVIYFDLISVLGGIVLSSAWLDLSLLGMLGGFIDSLRLSDLFYSLLKSAGFGFLIGIVPCVSVLRHRRGGVPAGTVNAQALMQTLLALTACNALFAYLVYGVLLFGIVRG